MRARRVGDAGLPRDLEAGDSRFLGEDVADELGDDGRVGSLLDHFLGRLVRIQPPQLRFLVLGVDIVPDPDELFILVAGRQEDHGDAY